MLAPSEPDGIRLQWADLDRVFDIGQLPIVLGRSTQAAFCITDVRVSRSHARIDWHAGSFTLTDLSFNGSYVRFGSSGELLTLRRSACTLHVSGSIGLGSRADDADAPLVFFEEDGARTVRALADGGLRAVAVELPGLQRADASDPAALAPAVEAVAGVAALMSARRLALVGHGLGGAVALQLLALRPTLPVHALVLADAASAPVQSPDLPTLRLTAAAAGHGCIEQPEVFNAAVLSFLQSHGFGS